MKSILYVALGGALGATSRYLIGLLHPGTGFPWATWIANALGCLLFGFLLVIGEHDLRIGKELAPLLLTGFLGGLTTFSTFISDTHSLVNARAFAQAAANLGGQLVLGLAAFWIGARVAEGAVRMLARAS